MLGGGRVGPKGETATRRHSSAQRLHRTDHVAGCLICFICEIRVSQSQVLLSFDRMKDGRLEDSCPLCAAGFTARHFDMRRCRTCRRQCQEHHLSSGEYIGAALLLSAKTRHLLLGVAACDCRGW